MHKLKNFFRVFGVFLFIGGVCSIILTTDKKDYTYRQQNITSKYWNLTIEPHHLTAVLSNEIGGPLDYIGLIQKIRLLSKQDTIDVYLAGNGGRVDGAEALGNALRNTPADVTMILFGDVYSAHAALATQGKHLKTVDGNIRLMFHEPAYTDAQGNEHLIKDFCNDKIGIDRGIPSKLKCELYIDEMQKELDATLFSRFTVVLTPEEYNNYETGHDVFITASDAIKRLNPVL